MKQIRFIYLFVMLGAGFSIIASCVEKIDFDLRDATIRALAVDGRLVVGKNGAPSIAQVQVSRLTNATVLSSTVAVKDITLENDKGQKFGLMKFTDGFFQSEIPANNPDFEINVDNTYRIIINTFDDRRLESEFEAVPKVPAIKEVYVTKAPFEVLDENGELTTSYRMKFTLDTDLVVPGEQKKSRLYWEALQTYQINDEIGQRCYIEERQSLADFIPIDGNELAGNLLLDHYFHDSPADHRYGHAAYLTVIQFSLSANAYDYRKQISQSAARDGSVFENPVGALLTNVVNSEDSKDPIYGYFFATQADTVHFLVDSIVTGFPLPLCRPYQEPSSGPITFDCYTQCCDCTVEKNSTLTKPSFWH